MTSFHSGWVVSNPASTPMKWCLYPIHYVRINYTLTRDMNIDTESEFLEHAYESLLHTQVTMELHRFSSSS